MDWIGFGFGLGLWEAKIEVFEESKISGQWRGMWLVTLFGDVMWRMKLRNKESKMILARCKCDPCQGWSWSR